MEVAFTKQPMNFLSAKANSRLQGLILDDISGLLLTELNISTLLVLVNRGLRNPTFPQSSLSFKGSLVGFLGFPLFLPVWNHLFPSSQMLPLYAEVHRFHLYAPPFAFAFSFWVILMFHDQVKCSLGKGTQHFSPQKVLPYLHNRSRKRSFGV